MFPADAEQALVESGHCLGPVLGQQVAVAIHGCLNRRVAQLPLDEFAGFTQIDQQSRAGVTQIMKANAAQACRSQVGVKPPSTEVLVVQRSPVIRCEDEVVILVCRTHLEFLSRLVSLMVLEGLAAHH
jgi:hypothetical protein